MKLVVQPRASPKSLSEAVLCARPLIGTQPFLLLLGDHIYHSLTPGQTCAQQLAQFWANAGSRPRPLVALRSTPASQIHRFGTVGGVMDMEVQFSADDVAGAKAGDLSKFLVRVEPENLGKLQSALKANIPQ